MNEMDENRRTTLFFILCFILYVFLINTELYGHALIILVITFFYHFGAYAVIASALSEKNAYKINNIFSIIRCILIIISANTINPETIVPTDSIFLLITFFVGLPASYYVNQNRENKKYTLKYNTEVPKYILKKYKLKKEKTIEELKSVYNNVMFILTQKDQKLLNKLMSQKVFNTIDSYMKSNSKQQLETPNEINEVRITNITIIEDKLIIEVDTIEKIYEEYYERNNRFENKVTKTIIFSKDLKNKNKVTEWFIEDMIEKQ